MRKHITNHYFKSVSIYQSTSDSACNVNLFTYEIFTKPNVRVTTLIDNKTSSWLLIIFPLLLYNSINSETVFTNASIEGICYSPSRIVTIHTLFTAGYNNCIVYNALETMQLTMIGKQLNWQRPTETIMSYCYSLVL